jgi:hypothetical protein
MSDITLMLQAASRGERLASEELLPLVYEERRRRTSSHSSAGAGRGRQVRAGNSPRLIYPRSDHG